MSIEAIVVVGVVGGLNDAHFALAIVGRGLHGHHRILSW